MIRGYRPQIGEIRLHGRRAIYKVGNKVWWNININVPADFDDDPDQVFTINTIQDAREDREYLRKSEPRHPDED